MCCDSLEISLSKGGIVLIDPGDADLAQCKWHLWSEHGTVCYAYRRTKVNAKWVNQKMHRLILERMLGRSLTAKEQVDHKNSNGLDNRRDNLRLATHAENCQNSRKRKDSQNKYKGVFREVNGWVAAISIKGKRIRLGLYHELEDAAIAYNRAAQQNFGQFARFNPIPNWETRSITPLHRKRGLHSSLTGAYRGKGKDGWYSSIKRDGKCVYLGSFRSAEEAHAAFCEAAKAYDSQ